MGKTTRAASTSVKAIADLPVSSSSTSHYAKKYDAHQSQQHRYHQYYSRDCKICRQYVNDLYHKFCYYENVKQVRRMSNRRRANCGHSCLKYTIVSYCVLLIVLSISLICYASKLFGLMSGQLTVSVPKFQTPRVEIYAIIVSSVVMLLFFVGLIGSLLESLMCLRIFGGILAYLFLLTFGAFLYAIILLILSNATVKLIASVIACAASAIIVHASMAIAPFAFADLIQQERDDDYGETTYVKYPSVRYFHPSAMANSAYPLVPSYPPYGPPSQGPSLAAHETSESRYPTAAKMSQVVRFEDDWL